jgi:hypothetical protein
MELDSRSRPRTRGTALPKFRKRKRDDLSLIPIERDSRAEKRRALTPDIATHVLVFHEKMLPIEKKDFDRTRAVLTEKLVSPIFTYHI